MFLRMMDNRIWSQHKICVNDKKKSQGRKGILRPSQKGLELLAKAFGCSPTGPGEQLWRGNWKPYYKNKIEFWRVSLYYKKDYILIAYNFLKYFRHD